MSDTNLYKCHIYDGGGILTFDDGCQIIYTVSNPIKIMMHCVLNKEYGPKTADRFYKKFAEYLISRSTLEFTLTSGLIDFIVNKLEKHEYSTKI